MLAPRRRFKKRFTIGLISFLAGFFVLIGSVSAVIAAPDVADSYEYDNSRGFAQEITLASPQSHTIAPQDDNDWLVFYSPGPGLYVLKFVGVTEPLKVELWVARDDQDKEKRFEKFKIPRGASQKSITMVPSTRYVKIRIQAQDDDEEGIYQVSIQAAPTYISGEAVFPEILIDTYPRVEVDITYGYYDRPWWPFGYFYYSTGRHHRRHLVIHRPIVRPRHKARRFGSGNFNLNRSSTFRRGGSFRNRRTFVRPRSSVRRSRQRVRGSRRSGRAGVRRAGSVRQGHRRSGQRATAQGGRRSGGSVRQGHRRSGQRATAQGGGRRGGGSGRGGRRSGGRGRR